MAISYDDLNRLVQVDQGDPAGVRLPIEDYAYDGEGNRLASHLSSLYSSNAHNQLLEDDRYTYTYDARGNRVSRTDKATGAVETYSYDSQNRLVGYASDTTAASYAYDAMDRRIAKTVDGVVEAFVYDPWNPYRTVANDVLLDFENGALTSRWLHGTKVDEPLAFEAFTGTTTGGSGTAYDLHADRLGSIISVVDAATGTAAAGYTYDSFGTRVQVGALEQRYGFTAREVDAETGLMYFRARHYDAGLGQFIQRDPIGFAGGDLNLYAYVGNDPYSWTDPSGLAWSQAEYRNISGVGLVVSMSAMRAATSACLKNPQCRFAAANGLKESAGALADALGIGQPSGSSNPGAGAGTGSGLGGVFGALVGLGQKIGQALDDLGSVLKNEEGSTEEGSTGDGEPSDAEDGATNHDNEQISDNLGDSTYDEAEAYLDEQLRDGRGWEKSPTKNGDGVRYGDGRGNQIRLSHGYPGGNFTGPSTKAGPYAVVSGGPGGKVRIPLRQ